MPSNYKKINLTFADLTTKEKLHILKFRALSEKKIEYYKKVKSITLEKH